MSLAIVYTRSQFIHSFTGLAGAAPRTNNTRREEKRRRRQRQAEIGRNSERHDPIDITRRRTCLESAEWKLTITI